MRSWNRGSERMLSKMGRHRGFGRAFIHLTNNRGEITGVSYERLDILLINAVKERQQQIERQQKQIATPLTSNAALNARLRGVEKSLRKKAGSTRPRRRIAVQGR